MTHSPEFLTTELERSRIADVLWPSLGKLLSLPFLGADYRTDQTAAGQSGLHISSFFANLQPIITSARAQGNRVFLLAHSMGNWALQAAT